MKAACMVLATILILGCAKEAPPVAEGDWVAKALRESVDEIETQINNCAWPKEFRLKEGVVDY